MSVEGEPILVVDDEEVLREVISEKLRSAGFRCVVAGSTSEALERLAEMPFSLALADIRMPGASGMELLREIRIGYPHTSVIMVTGVQDTDTAIEAMRLGAVDYIVKPLNLDALFLAVERALETRRIVMENQEYRLQLEEKVHEQTQKVKELFLNSLKPIARALEDRDPYWRNHSQKVSELATALSKELSLPKKTLEQIRLGLQLQDIGKVGVKEEVLHKAGPLSGEEYKHLMQHTDLGAQLLSPVVDDPDVMDVIKYHHERWDGQSSPHGLEGEAIPLAARVAALVNAYVAITSPRPYRSAFSPEQARDEIIRSSGTLFDPKLVAAFMRLPLGELAAASEHA